MTSRRLSNDFSRPIPAMFCQVILMMEISEQFFHIFWKLNKTTWPLADFSKGLQITSVTVVGEMNLLSELWTWALNAEFARTNNGYEVLRFNDFQGPFKSNSKTFKALLCFQGLSRSWKND